MVTFVAKTRTVAYPKVNPLGYDFALLGLRAREARVQVIRKAATSTAARINRRASQSEKVQMLTELASATYRLLDPRNRSKTSERIQLCLLTAEEVRPVYVHDLPLVPAVQHQVSCEVPQSNAT